MDVDKVDKPGITHTYEVDNLGIGIADINKAKDLDIRNVN